MEDKKTQRNGLPFSPLFMTTKKDSDAGKAEQPADQEKRRPIKTLRVEDCSCSIWAREAQMQGETRTFYSCTFERSYKDRDGSYRYTKTFDLDSLGKLVTLCHQASDWITEAQATEAADGPQS